MHVAGVKPSSSNNPIGSYIEFSKEDGDAKQGDLCEVQEGLHSVEKAVKEESRTVKRESERRQCRSGKHKGGGGRDRDSKTVCTGDVCERMASSMPSVRSNTSEPMEQEEQKDTMSDQASVEEKSGSVTSTEENNSSREKLASRRSSRGENKKPVKMRKVCRLRFLLCFLVFEV